MGGTHWNCAVNEVKHFKLQTKHITPISSLLLASQHSQYDVCVQISKVKRIMLQVIIAKNHKEIYIRYSVCVCLVYCWRDLVSTVFYVIGEAKFQNYMRHTIYTHVLQISHVCILVGTAQWAVKKSTGKTISFGGVRLTCGTMTKICQVRVRRRFGRTAINITFEKMLNGRIVSRRVCWWH